jgi:hypothetical protein
MADREIIKKSLEWKSDEELHEMCERYTGISTREVDKLVQRFFTEPPGTPIPVCDHYYTRQADEFLFDRLAQRLATEHNTKFHKTNTLGRVCIVRDEPTIHELVKEELIRRTGVILEPPTILFKYKLKYR